MSKTTFENSFILKRYLQFKQFGTVDANYSIITLIVAILAYCCPQAAPVQPVQVEIYSPILLNVDVNLESGGIQLDARQPDNLPGNQLDARQPIQRSEREPNAEANQSNRSDRTQRSEREPNAEGVKIMDIWMVILTEIGVVAILIDQLHLLSRLTSTFTLQFLYVHPVLVDLESGVDHAYCAWRRPITSPPALQQINLITQNYTQIVYNLESGVAPSQAVSPPQLINFNVHTSVLVDYIQFSSISGESWINSGVDHVPPHARKPEVDGTQSFRVPPEKQLTFDEAQRSTRGNQFELQPYDARQSDRTQRSEQEPNAEDQPNNAALINATTEEKKSINREHI
uniref:Uncharacterized protein n=1 Tax=Acrobeloides nanus TaxID=290746 RepID=A0A914CA29_9BILA